MCSGRRAGAGDFLQQAVHHKGVACVDDAFVFLGRWRGELGQQFALVVGHPCHQPWVHAVATVGKHRIGHGHLHGCDRTGTQGHGQKWGVLVRFKAKARGPFLAVACAHRLEDADGDHILGARQGRAHGHRAVELAVVVFGLPGFATSEASVEEQWRIVDDRCGCEAFLQGSGVDERFEAGSGLTPGLGGVVELVLVKVKAAYQRADSAVARVNSHQGAFHFGELGGLPGLLGSLNHPNDGAATDPDIGWRLVAESRLHWLEPIAGDFQGVAVGPHGDNLLGVGFQHHGRQHIAVVRVVGQKVVDVLFQIGSIGGEVDELLRASVVLPALVGHDPLAQGQVSCILFCRIDGGVHVQAPCVRLVAVLCKDQLARHLGHVFGMDTGAVGVGADFELLLPGLRGLLGRNEAVLLHAINDVQLSCPRALVVADRVVCGRGLGQPGEHRCFGNRNGLKRLTKICF